MEAKFNFIPEAQLTDLAKVAKEESYSVTINAKHGYMRLSLPYVRDNGLNGTYIKLHADANKKAIAWKIMRETSLPGMRNYRAVKIYKSMTPAGQKIEHCQVSISKLLKLMDIKKEGSYLGLPIKKYKQGGLMGDELHYVELKK